MLPEPAVAVIGIGNMGAHYAARLLAAGRRVIVWNRTSEKTHPLVAAGATAAASVAEALGAATILISALEHSGAFDAAMLSAQSLAAVTDQHLIVGTSTVSPEAARTAARRLRERGAGYVDAPVSGGTRGAAAGTLTILAGAEAADLERARPVLDVLGKVHHLGAVGAGQTAKLVNQVIVAGTIGAVAEGLVLAERAGLDPAAVLAALQGGFADSRVLREHGERMVRRDFLAGASNRVFLKDLLEIRALAASSGVVLPLAEELRRGYQELIDAGYAEDDHSSYWRRAMRQSAP